MPYSALNTDKSEMQVFSSVLLLVSILLADVAMSNSAKTKSFTAAGNDKFRLIVNQPDFLTRYFNSTSNSTNVFVVELDFLRKSPRLSMIDLELMCIYDGVEPLTDLSIHFSSGAQSSTLVSLTNNTSTNPKEAMLRLDQPLKPEYTGRYTCSASLSNGVVKTISWYIYFYQGIFYIIA